MNENYVGNKPLLLIFFTIIFVIVISSLIGGVSVFGYKIKPVDLFMDIKPDSLIGDNGKLSPNYFNSQKQCSQKSFFETRQAKEVKLNYRMIEAGLNIDLFGNIFGTEKNSGYPEIPSREYIQQPELKDIPITGNIDQMKYFFNALKKAGSDVIRVAHYGDSGIEGDNITANIREELQKRFGGNGVGFLSITSQDITFRTTTAQSFSDNWKTISVFTANPDNIPLGINGFVSIPRGECWVKYQTTGWMPYLNSFKSVKLFYSNASNETIKYSFDGGAEQKATLKTGSEVKELDIKALSGSVHSVKLFTAASGNAYFYGVSLENGKGVYVDNFPWRGNTGLGFNNISETQFLQFGKLLNYKLIILAFGANETGFGTGSNSWYENQMIKVINKIKASFPQTSIILIGVGDRAVKRGTRFVTDPAIPPLIKVQEDIAAKTGIAFWNLFDAMGGFNSIESWVKSNPPLALMDYTHPSWQGAAKIGNLIAKAIINSYEKYK